MATDTGSTPEARRRFIAEQTALLPTPHVPEISLHVAHEAMDLWQKTEDELEDIGLPPPFWAFAWAGGQALARWLLDHPSEVAGKRVIDLATGSGLVAVAAMKAGAASVLAADIDPFCAAAVAANARSNSVEIAFTDADLLDAPPPPVDLICAGDVFYEKPMAEAVLAWLKQAQANGTRVIVGDPGRTYFPKSGLSLLAEYTVPTTRELEDQEVKRSRVWSLD